LLPPTGVILPFISYGGNAIILFMFLIGIVLNISRGDAEVAGHGSVSRQKRKNKAKSKGEGESAVNRRLQNRRNRRGGEVMV